MTAEKSSVRDLSRVATIGLTVHWNGMSRHFEFSCEGDRCVTAGSAPGVDLYLKGAAPIAFYLERDGAAIRLTPAYVDVPLRVDAQRVTAARWICGPATVELAEHRLSLVLGAGAPLGTATVLANCSANSQERLGARAIDAAATTTEFVSPPGAQPLRPLATVLIVPEPRLRPGVPPTAPVTSGDFDVSAQRAASKVIQPSMSNDAVVPRGVLEPMPVVELDNASADVSTRPDPALGIGVQRTVAIGVEEISAYASAKVARAAPGVLVATPREIEPVAVRPGLHNATDSAGLGEQRRGARSPLAEVNLARGGELTPAAVAPTSRKAPPLTRKNVPSESTVVELPVVQVSGSSGASELGLASHVQGISSELRSHTSPHDRPISTLARLGVLTKRYPVGVVGGTIAGSILLGVFLVGMCQILGISSAVKSRPKAQSGEIALARASLTAEIATASSNAPTSAVAPGSASPAPSGTALPDGAGERNAAPSEVSSVSDPDLVVAVSHLFSGRLPEAEQAYRDLALRYPARVNLVLAARLLARRNSPDCRPGNARQIACPTVKQ